MLNALLCSDLAIRSGTAAQIGPEHYDPQSRHLTFTTKYGAKQTMPVTEEIAGLIGKCDLADKAPFTFQLHRAVEHAQPQSRQLDPGNNADSIMYNFRKLRRNLGITRKLTAHDFRRTTAVKLYEYTRDARDVQALLGHRSLVSTIWYLDHDLRPVSVSALELIKRPNWRKQRTA
jgi:integrase